MKFLIQFVWILSASLAGELLHYWIPLPIPASIYGLVLLFIGLLTNKIPHTAVRETGHFLIAIMPVTFIPAAVGLITSFQVLRPLLLPYGVITVLVSLAVFLVSGRATQYLMRKQKGDSDK